NLIAALITLGLIAALRRGWFRAVTVATIVLLTAALCEAIVAQNQVSAGPYLALLMIPIVLAGLLLSRRWLVATTVAVVLGGYAAVQYQTAPDAPGLPLSNAMGNFFYAALLISAIVFAFGGSLRATVARVVAHERELEIARAELQTAIDHLRTETDERARLQGEIAQGSRLESIGRLAGGVAHDFNNLLTAISGYGRLLEEDLADDADSARQDVAAILQAADQAAALTGQLLAFSRRQELRMDVVDVGATVADVEPLLRRLIGEQVTLVVRAAPSVWPVLADRAQLAAVVVNLAVNARDAMPDGGTLTIETSNVVLDETYAGRHAEVTPGAYALVAVSDTGVGMDTETVTHIFEPFFTTKALGSGTGLGLATVYGTVRQSGGHIWVYSEPGQGTSFKIYLPKARIEGDEAVAAPAGAPEPARATVGARRRVLLAEDEDLVRTFVVAALERAGHEVVAAASADEALAWLADPAARPDILITDVVMPGVGGPELLERVREMRPGLPAVFMSGYTAGALQGRPMPAGAVLLEKPFTADGLEGAIATVIAAG
ncbi:MAG: two-component system, cell cycle sensor histidine kinase and response regulator CckA, partial [Chloroflexota bacterium]|nr:two-component system, cell cycle sensor histidine kinase and response regulator CckA [Chloroflexota bacterium]